MLVNPNKAAAGGGPYGHNNDNITDCSESHMDSRYFFFQALRNF